MEDSGIITHLLPYLNFYDLTRLRKTSLTLFYQLNPDWIWEKKYPKPNPILPTESWLVNCYVYHLVRRWTIFVLQKYLSPNTTIINPNTPCSICFLEQLGNVMIQSYRLPPMTTTCHVHGGFGSTGDHRSAIKYQNTYYYTQSLLLKLHGLLVLELRAFDQKTSLYVVSSLLKVPELFATDYHLHTKSVGWP